MNKYHLLQLAVPISSGIGYDLPGKMLPHAVLVAHPNLKTSRAHFIRHRLRPTRQQVAPWS